MEAYFSLDRKSRGGEGFSVLSEYEGEYLLFPRSWMEIVRREGVKIGVEKKKKEKKEREGKVKNYHGTRN